MKIIRQARVVGVALGLAVAAILALLVDIDLQLRGLNDAAWSINRGVSDLGQR